jgi:hypothetical protein
LLIGPASPNKTFGLSIEESNGSETESKQRTAMRSIGSALVALTSTAILAAELMLTPAASAQPAPFLGAAGNGVVRALIIGIDQYEFTKPLKGAVADAEDFETLQKLGVRDLTVLVNNAANRKSMLAAMERLNSISDAGDLIVLTLAGHGAREPERVKGSNADGFDKSFLFGGFHPRTGPGTAERILSTEIKAWLYRLEKRGIDVLFIADTCYGGGLVRSVDPRADEITYRNGVGDELQLLQDELKPISTTADAFRQQADFERVTFLAAADEQTLAPEVPIPGISGRRGALSYATARAIEGTSDRDRSGVITRRKLFEYSRQVVDQFSDNRQASGPNYHNEGQIGFCGFPGRSQGRRSASTSSSFEDTNPDPDRERHRQGPVRHRAAASAVSDSGDGRAGRPYLGRRAPRGREPVR